MPYASYSRIVRPEPMPAPDPAEPPAERRRRVRRALVLLATVFALVIVGPGLVLAQGKSPAKVDHNVMVPMRDGAKLATDVYRPVAPGTYPAILKRTPYGKDSLADEGTFFAQHGYVYVAQDTRGRGDSQGNFIMYVGEDVDGYDTALWLGSQQWFSPDKGFAVYGDSYMASTALSIAETSPPHLKALYIAFASANYHDDGAWRGGAFDLAHNLDYTANEICPEVVSRASKASRMPAVPLPSGNQQLYNLALATPLAQGVLVDHCPWYRDWTMNADQNAYWNQLGVDHSDYFDRLPPIPMAFMGGWFDQFLGGTVVDYQGAPANSPWSLTLGPWLHDAPDQLTAGDGYFGPNSTEDATGDALHWFDRYLKGDTSNGPVPNQVRYFLMGGGTGTAPRENVDVGGTWQTASSWPPPEAQNTNFYLRTNGILSATSPRSEPTDSYDYDPTAPVPTLGGNISSGSQLAVAGTYDQVCRPDLPACNNTHDLLANRPDVLTYQTDPLDQDTAVVGQVTAELWAATSAADTDFTAKLIDVYPDGKALNVADGIIRARYNQGTQAPVFITPGTVTDFSIDLWHTAMLFKAGHRIRVDISSSNFPHFDRNLNTGNPIGTDTLANAVVATQTIYHDATHPSHVVLPIMPQY